MRTSWATEVISTSIVVLVTADPAEQRVFHRLATLPGVTVDFSRMQRTGSGQRRYRVTVFGLRFENDALVAVLGYPYEAEYRLSADMQFPPRTSVQDRTSLLQQQRDARALKRPKKSR